MSSSYAIGHITDSCALRHRAIHLVINQASIKYLPSHLAALYAFRHNRELVGPAHEGT
jgi:hypothetical protein